MEKITQWILVIFMLLVILLTRENALFAQADTVYPGSRHLNTAYLKPGLKQYLVYHQWPQYNKMLQFQYWLRDISIEKKDGVVLSLGIAYKPGNLLTSSSIFIRGITFNKLIGGWYH